MMPDSRMRTLLEKETLKPRNLWETLSRLGAYFGRFWHMMVIAIGFVTIATWTQVTTPDLFGQATDCFLVPLGVNSGFVSSPVAETQTSQSESNCWLGTSDPNTLSLTHKIINSAFTINDFPAPESDLLTSEERNQGLLRLVIIMGVLYLINAIMMGLTFYFMTWSGQHVLRELRVEVFEHLHKLSLGFYTENETGDMMSRITNDTTAIEQAVSFALVQVFSSILLLVWITYNMLVTSLAFALLALAVAPLMFLATIYFSNQARVAFRKAREEIGSVNTELQETISAVREVQAFNRADENINHFKLVNAANRDANVRAVAFTSALGPTLEAMSYIALAIVAGTGGWYLLQGQPLLGTVVSLGLVVTFLAYVQNFNRPIQQISVMWTNIQNAIAGAERIFAIMDEVPAVQSKPDARDLPEIVGKVEFEHVSSAYKLDEPVLKDVSFRVEPGQTIAIVGPTGAGKTTIVNLLPRFWDVTDGSVKIDDIDVRDVTPESLRSQIGIVLQDTFLFSASVMDNIRFGRPDATDKEVKAAAKLAYADSFIDRMPEKYETVLGERGSGLSQGQRQLLSIARAALSDPKILILDEATSSVDTRTERLIQKAFDEMLEGRTAFVIAHRLSTIVNADVILVLDQGKIIERGRHNQLLAKKGFYYDLYMSQFQKQEKGHQKA
ncbi:MAG: ABC transporter ATP-binding protein [Anaerolineae bacterium]|nr:ABC transporter ATP-binding protein [Anaerolineae bacterium]MDK1081182.1 ABC transporter ATP-binding protein [Anaerolineae bacterium]